MGPVLIADTGIIVAFLDQREEQHQVERAADRKKILSVIESHKSNC